MQQFIVAALPASLASGHSATCLSDDTSLLSSVDKISYSRELQEVVEESVDVTEEQEQLGNTAEEEVEKSVEDLVLEGADIAAEEELELTAEDELEEAMEDSGKDTEGLIAEDPEEMELTAEGELEEAMEDPEEELEEVIAEDLEELEQPSGTSNSTTGRQLRARNQAAQIKNARGLCLDMNWADKNLIVRPCHGRGNQLFYWTSESSKSGNIDVIMNEATHLCVDYHPGRNWNNNAYMHRCHGEPNQRWYWSKMYVSKGIYYRELRTTRQDKCLKESNHRRRRHQTAYVGKCTNHNQNLWRMEGCANSGSLKCAPTPPPPPPPPCQRGQFSMFGGWEFLVEVAMDQTVTVTMGSTISNSKTEGTVAEVGRELSVAASVELQVCVGTGDLSPVSAQGCATAGLQTTASRSLRNSLSSDSTWTLEESSEIQHSFSPRRAGLALWQFQVSSSEVDCDTRVITKLQQFTWTESKYDPPVCEPHSCATEDDPWGRCCSCNPPSDRLEGAVTPASCSSPETIRQASLDRIQTKQMEIQSAQQLIDSTGDYCPGVAQVQASLGEIQIMLQDIQNNSRSARI